MKDSEPDEFGIISESKIPSGHGFVIPTGFL